MNARLTKLYSEADRSRCERRYLNCSTRARYAARAFNRADRKAAKLAAREET